MSITATRIGGSPLTLDWSNLARAAAGPTGTKPYSPDAETYGEVWTKLKALFQKGEVGFYDAPVNEDLSQAQESQALAEKLLARGTFTDCLFLGIGGSALGPISLLESLQDRRRNDIHFHFVENPDPVDWKSKLRRLKPESTLVVVVTKSGTTFETLSQFILALDWLGKDLIKTHVVAITDPTKGDLRSFSKEQGIATLAIAPSMGGRFSIFTPVGLFAAALAGLSVPEFLNGARQVRDYIEKTPLEKNAIFILADEYMRHSKKRPIHVCMPYSTRLRPFGAWYAQLWAESLGKDGKGFTPIAAVGATDQHSILQLLRDGPDDKITHFITIDKVQDEVVIPKLPMVSGFSAFRILEGHSMAELLRVEYQATSRVLTKQERPNYTVQLDTLEERSLGALYYFFSVLTAFTGVMWEVNPFDQPGVEEGKVYIREALNRSQG